MGSTNNIKIGKYKHFKGDIMEVIGVGLHSETLEEFVLYKHITGKRAGESNYWVRPLKMFLEKVEVDGHAEGRASKKVSRFEYIGQ
ncbi:MAG: DUF1653 domain-containing protein [Candidatus Nomurabacteria bacterium]|nr:DUF1653 domain-containing protein [Candidatus Nomurabacteria bacterium]